MKTHRDTVHVEIAQRRRKPSLSVIFPTLMLSAVTFLLTACDPQGKKECAWTLEPEIKLEGTVDPGFIPVCARNRKSMKEDCRLQTTLDFAKSVWLRKFRHSDITVKSPALPRTITAIKFCDGSNETLKPENPK